MNETNLEQHVGKTFSPKAAGQAEHRYTVTEHIAAFDFGPRRGGVQSALVVMREGHGTLTHHRAEKFLAEHDPAPSETAAA